MTAYTDMVLHLGHTHTKLAQAKAALEANPQDAATALIRVNSGISDIINGKNKATLVGNEMAADDAQIASLSTQVENLTAEVSSGVEEITALQSDIVSAQVALSAQATEITSQAEVIAAQDLTIAGLQDDVNTHLAELAAQDGQLADLSAQITAKDAEIAAGMEEIHALRDDYNDALAVISAKDTEIATLQARIAELEAGEEEPNPPSPPPPPPPPPAGFVWPDASNTGVPAGTQITAYTGPTNITANGTVIENKTINKMLVITGADCVIRNCLIQHNGMYGINADGATRLLVERSNIVGPGLNGQQNAGILGWANAKNNNISGVGLALNLKGTDLVITGNYVHDLGWGGANPHYDGVAFMGGTNGALVEDNYIHMPNNNGTASVFVSPHNGWGNCANIVVNHNKFLGSPGYAISIEKRPDGTTPTGCVVTNNLLQRGDWGYIAITNASVTRSGNVDHSTGASVD